MRNIRETRIRHGLGLVAVSGLVLFLGGGAWLVPALGHSSSSDEIERSRAMLLLSRASYGPRPGELESMLSEGTKAWIERQLYPQKISDAYIDRALATFEDLSLSTTELMQKYPRPTPEERKRRQQEREGPERSETNSDEMTAAVEEGSQGRPIGETNRDGQTNRRARQGRGESRPTRSARPGRVVVSLSQAKLLRASHSERQLQEIMVDFWFNHFNVYARKNRYTSLSLVSYERDAIRPNALGKFEDLLFATASHPAMLFYLDNWTNTKEGFDPRTELREAMRRQMSVRGGRGGRRSGGPASGRAQTADAPRQRATGLNENYARELLELHTLGVDGGYTQDDVVEVARAFTGWTVVTPELSARLSKIRSRLAERRSNRGGGARGRRGRGGRGADGRGGAPDRDTSGLEELVGLTRLPEAGNFYFNSMAHDEGDKVILGERLKTAGPAGPDGDDGQSGMEDGRAVVRLLSRHPSTARFISTKLAQRFVSDTPSEALVSDLSQVFLQTDGDIRRVLRHLFLSDAFVREGLAAKKVKTPLELVVSSVRATDARIEGPGLIRTLQSMGMPLYMCQPPTGYDEEADSWLSAGSVLTRVRFAGEMAAGRIPGLRMGTPPDDAQSLAASVLMSPNALSDEDIDALEQALQDVGGLASEGKRQELALLLASPAFQKQ